MRKVSILEVIYNNISKDAEAAYPHECCGALLGRINGDGSTSIEEAKPLTNTNTERARDRYEIDKKELFGIEKKARGEGLDVVGFYHSHPDHPSKPSQFDRDRGWTDYSYLIVSVEKGKAAKAASWSFSNPDDDFSEDELIKVSRKGT